jgi:hypothetical protein
MPTLCFEGQTHDEIVSNVRRWLASAEGSPAHLGPAEVVARASNLTKDALTVIAAAAPTPIAHSDVVERLVSMGYEATDQTKRAVLGGLNAVSELSDGRLVRRLEGAGRAVTYQMGTAAARQVLKTAGRWQARR